VVSDAYDELRDPTRRAIYDRSHPLARSPVDRPGGSVHYAVPGSQHVVLGRPAPLASPRARPSFGDEGRSLRLRGNIEDLAQLAISLLRDGW
jgi:curved DNA-binding protein CbpA